MPTAQLPDIGEVFADSYRIDGVLGEGGFARVFDATDLTSNQRVALKILKPGTDAYSAQSVARFRRETESLARLRSPHTVRVLDDGADRGLLFAVFEHVPGRDLSKVLAEQGRLPPDVAEHILRQLLEALGEAHRAGILHRDLKPENVRVTTRGDDPWFVKLLDFGIARPLADGSPSVTATGELVGTPRYMSPEQLTDKPLTPASDIYSLGMMTFELLAGRGALHGGAWTDQLERLLSGHQFAVQQYGPHGRLASVIQRMTAVKAAERLRTVDAVLHALDGGDVVLEEDRAPAVRWFWLVAGILLIAAAVVFFAFRTRSELDAPRAGEQTQAPPIVTSPPTAEHEVVAPPPIPTRDVLPAGCGKAARPGERQKVRGLRTYVPSSYDPNQLHSVIVLLHETAQTGDDFMNEVDLERLADEHRLVLVAPTGEQTVPTMKDWKRFASKPWNDENLNELAADLVELDASLCVDVEHVYAIGHGQGGFGVEELACRLGPMLTATAVTGYRYAKKKERARDCPVPTIFLSPRDFLGAPLDGARIPGCIDGIYSVDEHEGLLRERHGCDGPPTNIDAECRRWPCEVDLTTCRVPGGLHWPALDPAQVTVGVTETLPCAGPRSEYPYGEVILRFFASIAPFRRADQ